MNILYILFLVFYMSFSKLLSANVRDSKEEIQRKNEIKTDLKKAAKGIYQITIFLVIRNLGTFLSLSENV